MAEGDASPMQIGDMIGALTGRAALLKVDTIAEWRQLGGEKRIKEDQLNHYFSLSSCYH